jgi:hypothetical protein
MALGPLRRNDSDSNFVNLGRGFGLFSELNPLTGLGDSDGAIDLGNLTELTISSEDETFEHFSTRQGLRTRDVKLVIGREASISFVLDQTPMELTNLWLSGKKGLQVATNGLATTGDSIVTPSLFAGRWYELRNSNNRRVYGVSKADLAVSIDNVPAPNIAAVLTDAQYELLPNFGLIRVRANSEGLAVDEDGTLIQDGNLAGSELSVELTAPGDIPVVEQIHGLNRTLEGSLKFIQQDSRGTGQQMEFMFHKVTLSPAEGSGLISDEPVSLGFEGSIEENLLADPDSPFVTVSFVNPVA